MEKALALRQDDPKITPRILDRLAQAYYEQDRPENLTAFLARTAEFYGQPRDYLRQAKYLVKVGDVDSAKLAYRKAAYFAPSGDASPYIAIADFYISIDDQTNAATALRYGYYVNPKDGEVADRFRQLGLVPGPTQSLEPPKPEMLQKSWTPPEKRSDPVLNK